MNKRLKGFLEAHGFEVLALEGFGLLGFGEPGKKSEADIIALGSKALHRGPGAEGLLISCGGLRTLGVARPLEDRHRHSGGVEHAGGVLGGHAARRARAVMSPAAAGCWNNRSPPLCTEAIRAYV